MNILPFLLLSFSLIAGFVHAQTTDHACISFVLVFTDKPAEAPFDPQTYFHPKAFERRACNNQPVNDIAHYPLHPHYRAVALALSDSLLAESRWLNALMLQGSATLLAELAVLPFIKEVHLVEESIGEMQPAELDETDYLAQLTAETRMSPDSIGRYVLHGQTHSMEVDTFRKHNIDATGVRIAVLDAGFPSVDTATIFHHLHARKAIKQTYDFVHKREDVYGGFFHGSAVLACIAGRWKGQDLGLATGADFLLARTEQSFVEGLKEEMYWAAAAEWADRNGADIISSSLGYTHFRYKPKDLDGQSGFITQAARMAAARGMMVLNSAGNDGGKRWHFLCKPADADSVLAIGGTNPFTDKRIPFSSLGPNTRNVMKPDLSAYGLVMSYPGYKLRLRLMAGTSFSCPLVAGFAACVRQAAPELTLGQWQDTLRHAGHLWPYYDYALGYGVPLASRFYHPPIRDSLRGEPEHAFTVQLAEDSLRVTFAQPQSPKDRKLNLFYKVEAPNHSIRIYGTVATQGLTSLALPRKPLALTSGDRLVLWYQGHMQTFRVE